MIVIVAAVLLLVILLVGGIFGAALIGFVVALGWLLWFLVPLAFGLICLAIFGVCALIWPDEAKDAWDRAGRR